MLQITSPNEQVLRKIINFLSFRPRSWEEVRRRLKLYTDDQQIMDNVILFLSTHKLVDDQAFAKWWVSSRSASRSMRVISQELKQKGIPVAIIQELMSTGASQDLISLTNLMTKKLKRDKSLLLENRAKLFRYLASKGYSYQDIQQVFSELQ